MYYFCVISDFRCEINKNCVLLGYYTASSGNCLPTCRHSLDITVRFSHGTKMYKLFANISWADN